MSTEGYEPSGPTGLEPYSDQKEREEYPEHQLVPQKGGLYTVLFKGPPGTDIGDLHCMLQQDGNHVVNSSGWKPDEEQIAKLEAGAHVRVALWTHPIPPMAVMIEEPVCHCHGEPMVFDRDDCGYYCPRTPPTAGEGDDANQKAYAEARKSFKPKPVEDTAAEE